MIRSRLRDKVARKKAEARDTHVLETKRKVVELNVLSAQAQALITDIDTVSAKIELDDDGEAKALALEKLREQRASLEQHISGWRARADALRGHLSTLQSNQSGF